MQGREHRGQRVEVLANYETGTWTLVVSGPAGTCIIATGEKWEVVQSQPYEPGT